MCLISGERFLAISAEGSTGIYGRTSISTLVRFQLIGSDKDLKKISASIYITSELLLEVIVTL